MSNNQDPKYLRLAALAALSVDEKLRINYCRDFAGCSCPSTHLYSTVAVLPVASTRLGPGTYVDRCLQCGVAWFRKRVREDRTSLATDIGGGVIDPEVIAQRLAAMAGSTKRVPQP